ncbi:MAG: MFS transporter [Phycisphaerales bacterium]|nr:MFS transporter [Phycisphaerales bacterium]
MTTPVTPAQEAHAPPTSPDSGTAGVAASSWPPATPHKFALAMLILFRLARGIAAAMIAVDLPYLVLKKLHFGSLTLGAIYMVGVASTAVLGLAIGQLADRWSRKGTLLLSAAMLPISAFMLYLFTSVPMIFAAAVIGGFAATGSLIGGGVGGAAQPVQSAVIADLAAPHRRTLYFSLLAFLGGVAGSLGAMLVGFASIHRTFLFAGGISMVGALPLLWLEIPRHPSPPRPPHGSRKVMTQFTITGALNGFSQGLITPFLIPFFMIVFDMGKRQMAWYTAAANILGAVALLTAPLLERRFGFARSIVFTRALGTILLLLMAVWHFLPVALFIYIITPALRIAALPAQQTAITSRVHIDDIGRALAANQVARLSAASAAIICTGWLFDIAAVETPFFIYTAVMGANIYLYMRFFGRHETHAGLPAAAEPNPAHAAAHATGFIKPK